MVAEGKNTTDNYSIYGHKRWKVRDVYLSIHSLVVIYNWKYFLNQNKMSNVRHFVLRIAGQLIMYVLHNHIAVRKAYQSSDWPKDPCNQSPC